MSDATGPIVVVGDAMLDRDLRGAATRLCPDGVGPVVDVDRVDRRPGGAALTAALLAADGTTPTVLVTAVGDDEAGAELRSLLAASGVQLVAIAHAGATPTKERVRVGATTVARIDQGGAPGPAPVVPLDALATLGRARAVVASDYGRGLLERPEVRRALAAAARRVPVVWDPHPRGPRPVDGCAAVTPNRAEARHVLAGAAPDRDDDLAVALADHWCCPVVVTCGAEGAVVAAPGRLLARVPGRPAVGDACGAGDRFAGRLAGALADGAALSDAAADACVAAAGLVAAGPVLAMARSSEPTHARSGAVVAAGGCFDVLHAGHVRLLEQARRLGDRLVVLMNDDASVRRLKGAGRPHNSAADRRAVLLALTCVDEVITFAEDDPCAALERLRPDVFVKGAEYAGLAMPERDVVTRWGGRVELAPMLDGRSTTRVLRLLRASTG